jgi:hypothetical protein
MKRNVVESPCATTDLHSSRPKPTQNPQSLCLRTNTSIVPASTKAIRRLTSLRSFTHRFLEWASRPAGCTAKCCRICCICCIGISRPSARHFASKDCQRTTRGTDHPCHNYRCMSIDSLPRHLAYIDKVLFPPKDPAPPDPSNRKRTNRHTPRP